MTEPTPQPPERTIGELIGWQSITPGCCPEDDWGEPTVDDMLEFIVARLPHVGIKHDIVNGCWRFEAGKPYTAGVSTTGATVREAVADAVRSVAGRASGSPEEAEQP